MWLNKKISRKSFLKHFAVILSVPHILLALKTVLRHKDNRLIKEIRLPGLFEKDITFHKDLIIIKSDNQIRFFSSKCTHLGCKISTLKNEQLVCACHGSHFSLDGKVLNGPAASNLKELDYTFDAKTNEYLVKLV